MGVGRRVEGKEELAAISTKRTTSTKSRMKNQQSKSAWGTQRSFSTSCPGVDGGKRQCLAWTKVGVSRVGRPGGAWWTLTTPSYWLQRIWRHAPNQEILAWPAAWTLVARLWKHFEDRQAVWAGWRLLALSGYLGPSGHSLLQLKGDGPWCDSLVSIAFWTRSYLTSPMGNSDTLSEARGWGALHRLSQ